MVLNSADVWMPEVLHHRALLHFFANVVRVVGITRNLLHHANLLRFSVADLEDRAKAPLAELLDDLHVGMAHSFK